MEGGGAAEGDLQPLSAGPNSQSELIYRLMGKIRFKVALRRVFNAGLSDDDGNQMRLV